MLQRSDSVECFMNGSIAAVSTSGTTSMSLALIGAQPRIEEPSKPSPSSKMPSDSSAIGMVKCCQRPMKSMNFRSTMTAFLSLARPSTSFGFAISPPSRRNYGCGCRIWPRLERRLAALACPDADHLVDRADEDLAVADAAGAGGALDRLERLGHQVVGEHHLDLHLGQEVDDILGAPVQLGVTLLAAESLHLGDGEAEHADVGERLFHFVELEGLDDGFDLLHGSLGLSPQADGEGRHDTRRRPAPQRLRNAGVPFWRGVEELGKARRRRLAQTWGGGRVGA